MIEVNSRKIQLKTLSLATQDVLNDYRIAVRSRHASILGRREVMAGRAKFGIFGDGKEVAQLAMARAFRKGDFRSGYYRDQTFMFAIGAHTIDEFFAQLYANTDLEAEPATGGRAMNAHFATRSLDADGTWKPLAKRFNSAADVSPTGAQMPRLVGLAQASKLYRAFDNQAAFGEFSDHGNEIAFGTVGNATCAEGVVWESINAVGVLGAPMILSIWDDHFGISVSNEHQITKGDLSELLKGFQRRRGSMRGYDIHKVRGWDYPALVELYEKTAASVRKNHVPAIIHVVELTQPLGHSTSGSHERYKTKERLAWEKEHDCLRKMREWILEHGLADAARLGTIDQEEKERIATIRDEAWKRYLDPIEKERRQVVGLFDALAEQSEAREDIEAARDRLMRTQIPFRRDFAAALSHALILTRAQPSAEREALLRWKEELERSMHRIYSSHLHSESKESALHVPVVPPAYDRDTRFVTGFEVLNACFDAALKRDPRLVAFGEDVGQLGDVNQGFRGLQEKYGVTRVSDTGIREATILGQAIGLAMRGLRPLAEIQYLDYLPYALQIMSDDLATLHWRTRGGQKAPVIIRTRGHRLEGIWHSGSLIAGILHMVRGIHVLVPRDMTQAAGFYNTLLLSDEPAIVIEVLNAYRLKERLPSNIGHMTLPLGVPEILRAGSDITLVTYGACCSIVLEAASQLSRLGVDAEVIDVQSLLPLDLHGQILESLKRTARIAFIDEDVPGGTTAYLLQEVLENQGGYSWLDSPPITIAGKPHRPAYGSDGDYWSKPNAEQIVERMYALMRETNPVKFPRVFS